MYNWSVDEEKFKKEDPQGYEVWRLEQMINYGEAGEKISEELVRKHWAKIRDRIDASYRAYLELLLWPDQKKF